MILIPSSNPLPYLRVEDFFTDVQLNQLILPEIDYLSKSSKLRSAEDTGAARDRDGEIAKKNSGVFIEELYRDSSMSEISTVLKQFWNTKVCGAIESVGPGIVVLDNAILQQHYCPIIRMVIITCPILMIVIILY